MPKQPEPGYIRLNPDDGHSVSFPDTTKGTDTPVEFAAHALGVPTWGVDAANAIIDAATNLPGFGLISGFADGGPVGDTTPARPHDDPPATAEEQLDDIIDHNPHLERHYPRRRRSSRDAALARARRTPHQTSAAQPPAPQPQQPGRVKLHVSDYTIVNKTGRPIDVKFEKK
ncbi:hypothetical protein VX037_18145 [Gordonia sp. Z-3]|uniref:hypothetical protein n=1 Tax=Gordonia sp. Z-3 TaxID=3115408 RepID=UPI002E2D68B5|nr:hypothetical protein [Gordonia sp. Z-3]MED5802949.1 hypothetical protein [Gordonia sp. Z-3]